jgi:hypothetical protein
MRHQLDPLPSHSRHAVAKPALGRRIAAVGAHDL